MPPTKSAEIIQASSRENNSTKILGIHRTAGHETATDAIEELEQLVEIEEAGYRLVMNLDCQSDSGTPRQHHLQIRRTWEGGPLRQWAPTRPQGTNWIPYAKGGVIGSYVCDGCQVLAKGVYLVIQPKIRGYVCPSNHHKGTESSA